ncbi:hypothetical protein BLL42_16935 [Pseudomonas frederiksbergensis]|uniref:Uncharacterized protein n=1 Tax=Pseudomonas frederiksbergensis TaxID=104087 RepID=A0A1J0EN50_9PSED|nr:hypothetical protein BLL42_16935 [Pseudomonas frederiksbergensis]
MSIFLLLRVYAASLFHTPGWARLAIARLGELARLIGYRAKGSQQPSINPPGAICAQGGERVYIASTRLKEITNGMV